jgi:hypothetical protein
MGAFTSRAGVVSASVKPSSVASVAPTELEDKGPVEIEIHGQDKLYTRKALYCLDIQNRFRMAMIWTAEWVWFDRVVLILIFMNSLFLAINDYAFRLNDGKKSWRNEVVQRSEIFFLVLFTIEAAIKIIGDRVAWANPWHGELYGTSDHTCSSSVEERKICAGDQSIGKQSACLDASFRARNCVPMIYIHSVRNHRSLIIERADVLAMPLHQRAGGWSLGGRPVDKTTVHAGRQRAVLVPK